MSVRSWIGPGAAIGLVLVGPAFGQAARPTPERADAPCPGDAREDGVRSIGPDGDVTLTSGRTVRLADLRWPFAPLAQDVQKTWIGQPVAVTAIGPEDRWGRAPARLALPDRAGPIDLAELLVGEGLAIVDPGERDRLCRRDLLAIEAGARRAKRGLWQDTRVLEAADPEALKQRAGSFALVEGRIVSVGERRERTYLNFGRDFARDFSVSIPRRSWAAFKAAGQDAGRLKGRRVRVRGQLEMRRAPGMEITTTDVLEDADERPPPQ